MADGLGGHTKALAESVRFAFRCHNIEALLTGRCERLRTFERWLSVCVLAITARLLLGNLPPGLFGSPVALQNSSVNLPVAVLNWAMIFPIMVGVAFGSLRRVSDRTKPQNSLSLRCTPWGADTAGVLTSSDRSGHGASRILALSRDAGITLRPSGDWRIG